MPTHCLTLTTNDPATTAAAYRLGSAVVFKRLRRRYGPVEYFGAMEFTTGRAKASGGHRRLHGHYLLKFGGVGGDLTASARTGQGRSTPEIDVLDLEQVVRESWRKVTGAWVVEAAALVSPGAALGYLGLHHRKPGQAPPAEWRGMTERASKGYWSTPIAELRKRAQLELAAEAFAWRHGVPLELARLEIAARPAPELVKVHRRPDAVVFEPQGPLL